MYFLSSFPDALPEPISLQLFHILADIEIHIDSTIEWEYFYEIIDHLCEAAKVHQSLAVANQALAFL